MNSQAALDAIVRKISTYFSIPTVNRRAIRDEVLELARALLGEFERAGVLPPLESANRTLLTQGGRAVEFRSDCRRLGHTATLLLDQILEILDLEKAGDPGL